MPSNNSSKNLNAISGLFVFEAIVKIIDFSKFFHVFLRRLLFCRSLFFLCKHYNLVNELYNPRLRET